MNFKKPTIKYNDNKSKIVKLITENLPTEFIIDKLSDFHESDIADTLPLIKKNQRQKLFSEALNPRGLRVGWQYHRCRDTIYGSIVIHT